MRLLFIADGRSPTARSWLDHWIESGHATHLISTYPCIPFPGLASFHILPVAFSGMTAQPGGKAGAGSARSLVRRLRTRLLPLRYILGPLSLGSHQERFIELVEEIQPEIVHALRIPFEGMLAAVTPAGIPLVVSIWGNDLTLHARGSFLMKAHTRRTLQRCNALITDTQRDIRMVSAWGFDPGKPSLVVPGAGGIRLEEIQAVPLRETLPEHLPDGPIVVNPRGQRPGSLRQDNFFKSIPLVLEKFPQASFICPNLAGDAESEGWVERLGIRGSTKLWPHLEQHKVWSLYKRSLLYVSPSLHDGTPNSLLEAMACGCFPVVGNIESMKEWVVPGINGLLVDAASPQSIAEGIISALENPAMLLEAKNKNASIIAERAGYRRCMAMTEAFYRKVLGQ